MAIQAQRVTVTDARVALNTDSDDRISGYSLLITNRDGTNSVDIGGATVTTGTGVELKPGESLSLDLHPGEIVYAVAPALASARVDVLRLGVAA